MAMRVVVRYAATAIRGTVVAGYIADDNRSNLLLVNNVQLQQQFQSRTVPSSVAGELVCEVQYRPIDSTSFEFRSEPVLSTGVTAGISFPQLYCTFAGFPAGQFSVEVNTIMYLDTLPRLDASGDEEADNNSLALSGVTMDQAGAAAVRAGQPVLTNISTIEMLDSALSNMSRAMTGGRAGRRLRTDLPVSASTALVPSGGDVGMQNAPDPFTRVNGQYVYVPSPQR